MMLERIFNISACRSVEVSLPRHSQAAIGVNCNVCLISSSLKRTKKTGKRNLLLKEARGSPKSAAFPFISSRRVSSVVVWILIYVAVVFCCISIRCPCLPAASTAGEKLAFSDSSACSFFLFVCFVLFSDPTSYLICDVALARRFLSLTSFTILQTAFKERRGCLRSEAVGREREG